MGKEAREEYLFLGAGVTKSRQVVGSSRTWPGRSSRSGCGTSTRLCPRTSAGSPRSGERHAAGGPILQGLAAQAEALGASAVGHQSVQSD